MTDFSFGYLKEGENKSFSLAEVGLRLCNKVRKRLAYGTTVRKPLFLDLKATGSRRSGGFLKFRSRQKKNLEYSKSGFYQNQQRPKLIREIKFITQFMHKRTKSIHLLKTRITFSYMQEHFTLGDKISSIKTEQKNIKKIFNLDYMEINPTPFQNSQPLSTLYF